MQLSTYLFSDDGSIPNHPTLPLLVYSHALALDIPDPAADVEDRYVHNSWGGSWRNGIFDFHHYHSTAHEVLAIVGGEATVLMGGASGVTLTIGAGDVMILPAGTGHKRLSASPDLLVVGAYPPGQQWDLCRGSSNERPDVLHNIEAVPLPTTDPIFGATGPLLEHWGKIHSQQT